MIDNGRPQGGGFGGAMGGGPVRRPYRPAGMQGMGQPQGFAAPQGPQGFQQWNRQPPQQRQGMGGFSGATPQVPQQQQGTAMPAPAPAPATNPVPGPAATPPPPPQQMQGMTGFMGGQNPGGIPFQPPQDMSQMQQGQRRGYQVDFGQQDQNVGTQSPFAPTSMQRQNNEDLYG